MMNLSRKLMLVALLAMLGGCATSGDRPLQLIKGADPAYPPAARQQGVQGFVKLIYRVSVEGVVENVRVLDSQPPGVFDGVAVDAVQRWRYNAPKRGGQPVAADSVTTTMEFKLADAEAAAKYDGL